MLKLKYWCWIICVCLSFYIIELLNCKIECIGLVLKYIIEKIRWNGDNKCHNSVCNQMLDIVWNKLEWIRLMGALPPNFNIYKLIYNLFTFKI